MRHHRCRGEDWGRRGDAWYRDQGQGAKPLPSFGQGIKYYMFWDFH